MLSWIKKFLTPPTFADDDKTRVARLLYIVSEIGVAGAGLLAIVFAIVTRDFGIRLIATSTTIPVVVSVMALVRKGYVRFAAIFLVVMSWLGGNITTIFTGGVQTVGFGVNLIIVLEAGVLISIRAALVFGALSSLAGLAMAIAQTQGWLPAVSGEINVFAAWATQSLFLGFMAGLLYITVSYIQQSLRRTQRAEARLRGIIENAPDTILETDRLGIITLINRNQDHYLGKPAHRFIHADDSLNAARALDQVFATGENLSLEVQAYALDGSLTWNSVRIGPIAQAGQVTGLAVVATDITERKKADAQRKQAEEALRESEQRYRTLVETFPDIVMITDLTGRVVYANAALEKQTGLTLEDLQPPYNKAFIHPDDVDMVRKAVSDLMTSDKSHSDIIENRFIDKYDRTHWYSGIIAKTQYEKKPVIQTITRDITQRKQIEAEAEKLIAELEARNTELERYAYALSHELRTPLVTIRGYLGFLEKDVRDSNVERLKTDMARITEATNKMQRLLSELLELSRIGATLGSPQLASFDTVVHEALELLREHIQELGVQVIVASGLPDVYSDRARLVEVVQNLVDNACKFMGDQPAPRIEIGHRGNDENGNPIFYVRDNGIGIAAQYHAKIFGLFDKLDPNIEGTGVGLAIVKRIVEMHGGKIWVESELGHGATFLFSLGAAPEAKK